MLENITKVITRFFGIIAGSLSGISAILIAIGFLAERSHLKMLGFTTIPVDLNQYLYTGASLMGFLPGIIILESIKLLLEPVALIILSAILLILLSKRFQKMKDFWNTLLVHGQSVIVKLKIYFLVFFVLVQILALNWMVKAVLVENLLFSQNAISTPQVSSTQTEFTFLKTTPDTLKQLILSSDKEDKDRLSKYFTQLFLMTITIGLMMRYLTFVGNENQLEMHFNMKFWLVINFLLFATQIFLLPGNYGVLLLNNKYQEVKVQFEPKEKKDTVIEEKNLMEVNNRPPLPINKIRDQQIELNGLPFKFDIEASPKIFTDRDGDVLTYSVTTDKPTIIQCEIDNNFLIVSPLQKGKAQISVEAKDKAGITKSTSFFIEVKDEINSMGVTVDKIIPEITLVMGEKPYVQDLMAEPFVFKLLDNEPIRLSFRASSSMPVVADVKIDQNILTVHANSKGITEITIAANDGFGRIVSTSFKVNVMGQKLDWPVDDRLLLLYQSNDVFFLYSKLEKRIWYVPSDVIESMVYYGLVEIF